MGQGTDSCGGYDADYDTYYEGLTTGMWTQRSGAQIHISKMTIKHLEGAKRVAENAARRASFSCDKEKFEEWVEAFEAEIAKRKVSPASKGKAPAKKLVRGKKQKMQCHCGKLYLAREADLARGWGLSCSKPCAAIRRDYGRPAGKAV